jgi:hypothetical protein
MNQYSYYPQYPYYPSPRPRSSRRAWIFATIGAIALAVIIAVVGLLTTATPSSTTPSAQQPTTSIAYSPAEQQYLSNMHALGVTEKPDSELVATGYIVCHDVFDNGAAVESEVNNMMMQGWSMRSASGIVARAVVDLCSQNR